MLAQSLSNPTLKWQLKTYQMLMVGLRRRLSDYIVDCRLSKVAGCYGNDCVVVKVLLYYICRTADNVLFALKFYIKDGMPVVGLSHHIVVNGKHLFYPAIDVDTPTGVDIQEEPIFVWEYFSNSKGIVARHIVLPPRRTLWEALAVMKKYTDPMHWAVTARRIVKQGIIEDYAILRVSRLGDRYIRHSCRCDDPMVELNLKLRFALWV